MDGLLLVDKPAGWTSFDVVAKVRGILKKSQSPNASQTFSQKQSDYKTSGNQANSLKVKVGHTGTLDPLATGLLVLVLGSYCKRAQEFSKLDKTYEVTMRLGQTSTTGDSEGVITDTKNYHKTRRSPILMTKLMEVMGEFVGECWQTPPAYSAVKVGGQRAYKLARAGKEVKLEPRRVTIYGIKLTDYSYPEVKFTANVSSGTYIRSLVEDIGQKLDTGAYMLDLRRTEVGEFYIKNALAIEELTSAIILRKLLTKK
jgi:tRNA pseudouridine55 synthase